MISQHIMRPSIACANGQLDPPPRQSATLDYAVAT